MTGGDYARKTLYTNDPLRGDKRGHAIARKHKRGWPARKIAKSLNVPLKVVEETLRKLT